MNWGLLTQAERDAAYNNAEAVANSAALTQARNAASHAWRQAHHQHLDIAYGPRPRNRLDLFPAADPSMPCLVFIHGGYWQRNSREDFACLAEGLHAHGWSFAVPGYTLAPEASLTEIVNEIHASLDWLAAHGDTRGIGGPLVVAGWSAGGHLTAMALSHPRVVAGLAISGVFELGPLRDTYLNAKLKLTEDEVAALSPLRLPPVQKPLAIAYGTRELPALIADSRDLHAMRAAAHAPGALVPVGGADHFTVLDALREATGELAHHAKLLA
ncbi:alpha/beta hydrolase [Acidisphaera rubrifaciens]|nr:alpha/beta hydrolase [Acidisphaera rubrifaciens]